MTVPPDHELTPEDHLIAELVGLSQRLPGGYQIALGIRLEQSIASVEELFAAHQLPLREALVAELTLWRCHAEDGVKFVDRADQLVRMVLETVKPSTGQS